MENSDIHQIEDIWKSEKGYMVCGFLEHWDGRIVTIEEKVGTLKKARKIVRRMAKMVKGRPGFWRRPFRARAVLLKVYKFSHVYKEIDEITFMKR